MTTNCDYCTAEIEDRQVVKCERCGKDGLCAECLHGGHDDGHGHMCYGPDIELQELIPAKKVPRKKR